MNLFDLLRGPRWRWPISSLSSRSVLQLCVIHTVTLFSNLVKHSFYVARAHMSSFCVLKKGGGCWGLSYRVRPFNQISLIGNGKQQTKALSMMGLLLGGVLHIRTVNVCMCAQCAVLLLWSRGSVLHYQLWCCSSGAGRGTLMDE